MGNCPGRVFFWVGFVWEGTTRERTVRMEILSGVTEGSPHNVVMRHGHSVNTTCSYDKYEVVIR